MPLWKYIRLWTALLHIARRNFPLFPQGNSHSGIFPSVSYTHLDVYKRQALTDEQVERLLDTIRDLPPYVFVMIGLYAGLRREPYSFIGLQLFPKCFHLFGITNAMNNKYTFRSSAMCADPEDFFQ